MDLTGSLNVLDEARLPLLSKGNRCKRKRDGLSPLIYSLPFKLGGRTTSWVDYMKTIINGKPLQAMLDTKVDTVYMAKELADEVGLSYTKEKAM